MSNQEIPHEVFPAQAGMILSGTQAADNVSSVFPAQAGMIQVVAATPWTGGGIPRTGGDDPL